MRHFLILLVAMFAVACSKADVHKTSSDIKAVASEIKNDPAVKRTGEDIKVAMHKAGAEIKGGAQQAGTEIKKAGTDIKQSAHKAAEGADDAADKAKEKTS